MSSFRQVLSAMQPPERNLGGEPSQWRAAREEALRWLKQIPGWWKGDEEDDDMPEAQSGPGTRPDEKDEKSNRERAPKDD